MRYCVCGKVIVRRQGHGGREREYCSDRCRQRACRERLKEKRSEARRKRQVDEHIHNLVYQEIHRETWQDELEQQEKTIAELRDQVIHLHEAIEKLHEEIDDLKKDKEFWKSEVMQFSDWLASKDAEIVRLNLLLDASSNKKKRT